jgi:hypothetical protein
MPDRKKRLFVISSDPVMTELFLVASEANQDQLCQHLPFRPIATAFGPAPTTNSVGVDAVASPSEVSVGADCVLFASWVTQPSLSISVLSTLE